MRATGPRCKRLSIPRTASSSPRESRPVPNGFIPTMPATTSTKASRGSNMQHEPDVRIALTAERSAEKLRVGYTLTNEGKTPYYVYTCVAGTRHEPRPHEAYTAVRENDDSLHLRLARAPIPPGMNV